MTSVQKVNLLIDTDMLTTLHTLKYTSHIVIWWKYTSHIVIWWKYTSHIVIWCR